MDIQLIIIFGLIALLAFVLAAYNRLLTSLQKLKQEREQIHAEAREKAVRVVEGAKDKALEILSEAKVDSMRESVTLDNKLQEISESKMSEYKKMLQKISNTVETEAMRELSEFKRTLSLETVEGQKIVGEKISESMAEAQSLIEAYKTQRLSEVDKKVGELVKKITLEVLGKGIRVEDQTKIVIAALTKAKNDGFFG